MLNIINDLWLEMHTHNAVVLATSEGSRHYATRQALTIENFLRESPPTTVDAKFITFNDSIKLYETVLHTSSDTIASRAAVCEIKRAKEQKITYLIYLI